MLNTDFLFCQTKDANHSFLVLLNIVSSHEYFCLHQITEKLQASKKLLSCLDQVTKRWEAELGKYKDKNDAFGSYKYKTQWQNANTTVAVLLTNMKKVIIMENKTEE